MYNPTTQFVYEELKKMISTVDETKEFELTT